MLENSFLKRIFLLIDIFFQTNFMRLSRVNTITSRRILKFFLSPNPKMAKIVPTSPFVPIFDQPILVNVNGESASGLTGADHCKPLSQQSNILQAKGHQPSLNDFPKAPPSQVAANYILTQMKHINPPDNQVAGRLKYFVDNWRIITSDKTILETVQGYQIPFILRPHQWRKRITKPKLSEGNMFLEAIDDLLAKGAIKETLPVQDEFLSTVFLVKQSTKTRPIFNLKSLNQFIRKEKFKLEGLDQVKTMIQPNDYFMKLDLTDLSSHHQQSSEISPFSTRQQTVRISVSPVQPGFEPLPVLLEIIGQDD